MSEESRLCKIGKFIEKYALGVIGGLAFLFSFFISYTSLLHTTSVDVVGDGQGVYTIVYNIKAQIESVIYYNDNMMLNVIVLAVSLMICFVAAARLKKIKLRYSALFIFLWTFVLGTVWVLSSQVAPSHDSEQVTAASLAFTQNNFTVFKSERYFQNYSFQLGYVLFNEIIMRITGKVTPIVNMMFLEVYNAFFLAVINVFILLINDKLFEDKRVNNITVMFLALSIAPIISCSFIYGIYPGMMFAVIALYCEIRYLKDDKLVFGILSVLSITMAVMIKSNYLIWLIAIVAICFVKLWRRKKYVFDIMFIILAVGLSLSVQPAVKSLYEKRSGVDLGEAVPYTSWIAMGLNESDLAPGWYNLYYTLTNFENSNFDAKEASSRSMEEIKVRLKHFVKNPQYANDFFYLKVVSQWNDTAYQSIWNNVVRYQYDKKGKVSDWVCNAGKTKVKKYMDYLAQLIFFAFVVGCLHILKKRKFIYAAFPLVFIGGFMYQFISEGKSQYIIPYFIVMTGFAAYGTVSLYDKFAVKAADNVLFSKLLGLQSSADSQETIEEESDNISEETTDVSKDNAPKKEPKKTGNVSNKKKKKSHKR